MRPESKIQIKLTNGHNVYDIKDGVISLDIITGIDSYEGPWQQPDVGQFTLVSRNPLLDPYINPDVRFNSKLSFRGYDRYTNGTGAINESFEKFFTGYITDVNVEYVPNDDPIITINGVDGIGLLKRTIITDAFITKGQESADDFSYADYPDGIDIEDFLTIMSFNLVGVDSIFKNFSFDYKVSFDKQDLGGSIGFGGFISYRPARFWPQPGESVWDTIIKYARTNLDFVYFDNEEIFQVQPYAKYNPNYWFNITDPKIEFPTYDFSSDSDDNLSYKGISLIDGFSTITNQVNVSITSTTTDSVGNTTSSTQDFPIYSNTDSITSYGVNELNIELLTSTTDATQTFADRYAIDSIQFTESPTPKVKEIIFDAVKVNYPFPEFEYYFYEIGSFIRIKHKLSPTQTLDEFYTIVGKRHSINYDEWQMSFILKPFTVEEMYNQQQHNAQINLNSNSGDTNFMFSATIANYPVDEIDEILWLLNAPFYSEYDPVMYDFAVDGTFSSGTQITGSNPTWNYDAGGIFTSGNYGPGTYSVIAWIRNKKGFIQQISKQVTVTAAVCTANFSYSANQYGGITFTDSSYDADQWTWNFGDGTTSILQNPPLKYYFAPGTYSVSLTISNGITTSTKTVSITVNNYPIEVKYVRYDIKGTRTRASGTAPWNKYFLTTFNELQVRNASGNIISSAHYCEPIVEVGSVVNYGRTLQWVQPENSVSTTGNALTNGNYYVNTGYTILPLVTNNGNTEQYDVSFVIEMNDWVASSYIPETNQYLYEGKTYPNAFNFIDSWIFANIAVGIQYEPVTCYVSSDKLNWYKVGDFNVYRTTAIPAGSILAYSLDNKPPVMPPFYKTTPDTTWTAPNAAFTYAITNNGATYTFSTDNSNGANKYKWSFGDGTTSTLQNPVKIYNKSGQYQVTLKKYNKYGSVSSSQVFTVAITVNKTGTKNIRYLLIRKKLDSNYPYCNFDTGSDMVSYPTGLLQIKANTNGTLENRAASASIISIYNHNTTNTLNFRTNNTDITPTELLSNTYKHNLTNGTGIAPSATAVSTNVPSGILDFSYVIDLGASYNDIYEVEGLTNKHQITKSGVTKTAPVGTSNQYNQDPLSPYESYTVFYYNGTGTPSSTYVASEWVGIEYLTHGNYMDNDFNTWQKLFTTTLSTMPAN